MIIIKKHNNKHAPRKPFTCCTCYYKNDYFENEKKKNLSIAII